MVLTGVAEIEAGHYHGIALKTDGTVWTWGYGSLGQLGLGTTNNRTVPTQVPGISDAIAVAAGRDMSYVLSSNRHRCWRSAGNTFGEVGDGTTTRREQPGGRRRADQRRRDRRRAQPRPGAANPTARCGRGAPTSTASSAMAPPRSATRRCRS